VLLLGAGYWLKVYNVRKARAPAAASDRESVSLTEERINAAAGEGVRHKHFVSRDLPGHVKKPLSQFGNPREKHHRVELTTRHLSARSPRASTT